MAGYTSRNILVCAFPAVVFLMTIIWYRRKKRRDVVLKSIEQNSACNGVQENTSISLEHLESDLINNEVSSLHCNDSHSEIDKNFCSERTDIHSEIKTTSFHELFEDRRVLEIIESSESKCSIKPVPESVIFVEDNLNNKDCMDNLLELEVCETANTCNIENENSVCVPSLMCGLTDGKCIDIYRTTDEESEKLIDNSEVNSETNISDIDTSFQRFEDEENNCNLIDKSVDLNDMKMKENIFNDVVFSENDTNLQSVICSNEVSVVEINQENECSVKVVDCFQEFEPVMKEQNSKIEENIINSVENSKSNVKDIETSNINDESHLNYNSMQQEATENIGTLSPMQQEVTEDIGTLPPIKKEVEEDIETLPPNLYSDVQSEGSSDSGKGGSDIQMNEHAHLRFHTVDDSLSVYEFELPQDLCGRLIGRQGKSVNYIKNHSNANVFIKKHPSNPRMKICTIEGNAVEITTALDFIRRRFPPSQFPTVTLTQFNTTSNVHGLPVPDSLQLHLPDGVHCDVIMSSMVTAGHFFLQQPTQPSYPNLSRLDSCMVTCYTQMDTPQLPLPIEAGVICAAPVMSGWYRAQVVLVCENMEECEVKFVDYGGYSRVPISSLRQIRSDFMTLPFQATECYLANVQSLEEDGTWPLEASATFEELAQGQIIQALIVGYADDGIPYVRLYKIQGIVTLFINQELVNRGVAQWVD